MSGALMVAVLGLLSAAALAALRRAVRRLFGRLLVTLFALAVAYGLLLHLLTTTAPGR